MLPVRSRWSGWQTIWATLFYLATLNKWLYPDYPGFRQGADHAAGHDHGSEAQRFSQNISGVIAGIQQIKICGGPFEPVTVSSQPAYDIQNQDAHDPSRGCILVGSCAVAEVAGQDQHNWIYDICGM